MYALISQDISVLVSSVVATIILSFDCSSTVDSIIVNVNSCTDYQYCNNLQQSCNSVVADAQSEVSPEALFLPSQVYVPTSW